MSEQFKPLARRTYSSEDLERFIAKHRTWGRWGEDDELGHGNLITAHAVRTSGALIKQGKLFSLAIPMNRDGPQSGDTPRLNPQHLMLKHGGDILADWENARHQLVTTDDAVFMGLQSATQWDSFAHIFYKGRTYNGQGPETVTAGGAARNSISAFSDRLISRGVLLDVARHLGLPHLSPGDAIQAEDLERCADAQGVKVGEGDIVLVRTGHMARSRIDGGWGNYMTAPAPGLGLSTVDYLCPKGVVAVASDTMALETTPFECPDVRYPVHAVLLANAGVLIGEIWDLEELARDCANDGVFEFFLSAVPLPITGAVGAPINPIAIK